MVETEDDDDTKTKLLYKDWNPMLEESCSFLNTFGYGGYNPAFMLAGEHQLKTNQIPCQHYDGKGDTCFKKQHCVFSHDKLLYLARITNNPKLGVPKRNVEVLLVQHLKPQQRAPDSKLNVGILGSVTDPNDFYIVPYGDWSCACKKANVKEHKEGNQDDAGVDILREMWNGLDYFTSNPLNQINQYVQNQLVAVKAAPVGGSRQWCRAVVLEDVMIGDTNEFPVASLRLIDYGSLLVATTKEMIPLPKPLLRYPPLAYRCALYGFSPVRYKYGTSAKKKFLSLVHGQECMFTIRQTIATDEFSNAGMILSPYLVDLLVKIDGKFQNMGKCLADEGLALAWQPFPSRPFILKSLDDANGFGRLHTKMEHSHFELDPKIPQEVVDMEVQRIANFLERIPVCDNDQPLVPDPK